MILNFKQAFLDNERQVRINTGKLACALVVVLMPFGVLLDYAVYPDKVGYFFRLRLLCSILVGIIWLLHRTGGRETITGYWDFRS